MQPQPQAQLQPPFRSQDRPSSCTLTVPPIAHLRVPSADAAALAAAEGMVMTTEQLTPQTNSCVVSQTFVPAVIVNSSDNGGDDDSGACANAGDKEKGAVGEDRTNQPDRDTTPHLDRDNNHGSDPTSSPSLCEDTALKLPGDLMNARSASDTSCISHISFDPTHNPPPWSAFYIHPMTDTSAEQLRLERELQALQAMLKRGKREEAEEDGDGDREGKEEDIGETQQSANVARGPGRYDGPDCDSEEGMANLPWLHPQMLEKTPTKVQRNRASPGSEPLHVAWAGQNLAEKGYAHGYYYGNGYWPDPKHPDQHPYNYNRLYPHNTTTHLGRNDERWPTRTLTARDRRRRKRWARKRAALQVAMTVLVLGAIVTVGFGITAAVDGEVWAGVGKRT